MNTKLKTNFITIIGTTINSLYLLVVEFFAIAIAHNHPQLVSHRYFLDYNETGTQVITATIAQYVNEVDGQRAAGYSPHS